MDHFFGINKKQLDELGLTTEQMELVRRSFRRMDTNGNGDISPDEVERAARALGYNPSRAEVKGMVEAVDTDGNGQIDFFEFAQMMRDQFGALDYQQMTIRAAFEFIDKDGNGYIDYDELREVLLLQGEPLNEKDFQKVIDDLDANHDGRIEFEELSRRMCRLDDDDK